MINFNEKTRTLTFSGKDQTIVAKYAKKHKLSFKEVVYLAIMNGIAGGYFEAAKGKKRMESTPVSRRRRT